MVLNIFSSPPKGLSLEDVIKLANEQLENAREAKDPTKKLQFYNDVKSKIKDAEKIFVAKRVGAPTHHDGIATAYHEHAKLLDDIGHHDKAQKSHGKAKDWGYIQAASQQTNSSRPGNKADSTQQSVSPPIALPTASTAAAATNQDILNLDISQPIGQSYTQEIPSVEANVDAVQPRRRIFTQDVVLPSIKYTLPESSDLITSTPQLAYCMSLSLPSLAPKEGLSEAEYEWSQAKVNDPDEQERLKTMATDLIRAFVRDDTKNQDVVAEVVCLAAVLDQVDFRKLLQAFADGIEKSVLLKVHLIDGLAQLMRDAQPGYIDMDDLIKILELLNRRLKGTHPQSTQNIRQLTQAVSCVLDSMVDNQVKDLKREQLHEPLSEFLKELQTSSDSSLVYQAAYAYQALQYIPDDETVLQTTIRRTGKVIRGISGSVSAVKAMNLEALISGLKDIQGGLDGAVQAMELAKETYDSVKDLAESGQNLLESLKEGFSFNRKTAWYPALRGLDTLRQEGRLSEFEKLIREAPCRRDLAFQWGVCQRLGEMAASKLWGSDTCQHAISFLRELYSDDTIWELQINVKQWIFCILKQLSSSSDTIIAGHSRKLLLELESNGDNTKQSPSQSNKKEYPCFNPLAFPLLPGTSPLLDCVLGKVDVEAALYRLRIVRLKERDRDVYISPRAKANLKATEDFDLTSKVQEFLSSNKKVLLLLGDSGAGKSTFNRALETDLWDKYEKVEGRIPLFVHLPTIDKPEYDLISKQLRKLDFTEHEINELRLRREFVLICDGYDESQQTRNLYVSNHLNQSGGWKVQMIVGCRTEYTGVDYKDSFQPTDGDSRGRSELFQETIIMPFNKDQIQDYINQYVSLRKPLWELKDYERALKEVPNLQDLVKNPFLLKLSLEVLPQLVDKESDLSTTRITRIGLYDEFVAQWLERGKIRLTEMELSPYDTEAFSTLYQFGFSEHGTAFLKDFSAAVYDHQDGNPVVSYPELRDGTTWKEAFFNKRDGNNLLLESMPMICSGIQYRFIHRSVLEYGLTLAVFDPKSVDENKEPTPAQSRRGSTSSDLSFEVPLLEEKTSRSIEDPLMSSPLGRKNFVNERSVLLFLVERAQQQPVFMEQLHAVIQLSKTEKSARIAAANALTVLVKTGIQFIGSDLRGIKTPGADLSYGMFDSAQLEGADLRRANLYNVWFQKADLSRAQMKGAQFGELPHVDAGSMVNVCAFLPGGKTFAAGLASSDVYLYNTSDWSKLHTLEGHSNQIYALAYSPDGVKIASASMDGTVRLWDVEAGNCLYEFQGHDRVVKSVAYSPKGDQVASGSWDKTARLWDVKAGNCVHILEGHSAYVVSVVYSPSGDKIASGSIDKTVKLWDIDTGSCIHTFHGHGDIIPNVAYSPTGKYIASVSYDKTIRLWDVETGNCVYTLEGHSAFVTRIAFSPKGDQIASGSYDSTIKLWDVEAGTCIHTLKGHDYDIVNVVYSPKGDRIASGGFDSAVKLWDVETGTCLNTFQGHVGGVNSVSFSPNGDLIASGCPDGKVRLWDTETGNSVHSIQGHSSKVMSIAHSPRRRLIASGSMDNTVRLWDDETGNCVHTLQGHSGWVDNVVYSPKEDQIASGSDDKTIRLWDVGTGRCTHTLQGHTNRVTGVTYAPNGGQIASTSRDYTVRLWDVETGSCVQNLQGHEYDAMSIMYSPNGDLIATGSGDKTVRLWDVKTGNCLHILRGHSDYIFAVVFSPKGNQFVSGCYDKTARIWDIETGNCIHTLEGHNDRLRSVAYSPSGDQIATASWDMTVKLWDVETGECTRTLQGHSAYVLRVAYSPKGDLIVSSGSDRTVRLWSIETGECLVSITCFDAPVGGIAWDDSPSGLYFVTGSDDRSVRRWQVIKNRDGYDVVLCWSSSHRVLTVLGASFNDVQGLSTIDWMLLRQGGVLNPPPFTHPE